MTLVLVGKGLVLGGWPSKIEVIWVPGTHRIHDSWCRAHEVGLMCLFKVKTPKNGWNLSTSHLFFNSLSANKFHSHYLIYVHHHEHGRGHDHGRHGHGLWIHDCVHGHCDRGHHDHHDHHGHHGHHDHDPASSIPGKGDVSTYKNPTQTNHPSQKNLPKSVHQRLFKIMTMTVITTFQERLAHGARVEVKNIIVRLVKLVNWSLYLGCGPLPGCQWPPELWHFLVENPHRPSLTTVTVRGPHPMYTS